MCAIGAAANNSIAATSAQATGLGAAGAIGGTLLTGARRVSAAPRLAGTVLAGGGSGGAAPPRSRAPSKIIEM